MPPPRPRPTLEDTRSETPNTLTSLKDRATGSSLLSKGKKSAPQHAAPTSKPLIGGGSTAAPAAESVPETNTVPQTDWTTIRTSFLHTYRGAYRIQTQSAYTQPNAETIYNSSTVGLRSPSMVLQRRKQRELSLHRRKLAQINGISKPSKTANRASRYKDDASITSTTTAECKTRPIGNGTLDVTAVATSIEPSPPAAPPSISSEAPSTLLNASNPEDTIIGRQTPTSLATVVRKHFNAQQLSEPETIARFTYVVKQQGNGCGTHVTGAGVGQGTAARIRAARPVRVEGTRGDGLGSIMGSMGREVRIGDTGGGAFRLRFHP